MPQFENHYGEENVLSWAQSLQLETILNMPFPNCRLTDPPHLLPVAVDLGANIGVVSKHLCSFFERVYAFEPVFETCRLNKHVLEMNINSHTWSDEEKDRIKLFNLAVGSGKERFSTLYGGINSGEVSLFSDDHPDANFSERCVVISLDEVFDLCEIDYIDFLKVDTEGAEYEMFYNTSKLNDIGAMAGELHGPLTKINELKSFLNKTFHVYTNPATPHIFFATNRNKKALESKYTFRALKWKYIDKLKPDSGANENDLVVFPPLFSLKPFIDSMYVGLTPAEEEKMYSSDIYKSVPEMGWIKFGEEHDAKDLEVNTSNVVGASRMRTLKKK